VENLLESEDIKYHVIATKFDELPEAIEAKEAILMKGDQNKVSGLMELIHIFEQCSCLEE
jgi:GTP-binding protein EngB required for normal cell division